MNRTTVDQIHNETCPGDVSVETPSCPTAECEVASSARRQSFSPPPSPAPRHHHHITSPRKRQRTIRSVAAAPLPGGLSCEGRPISVSAGAVDGTRGDSAGLTPEEPSFVIPRPLLHDVLRNSLPGRRAPRHTVPCLPAPESHERGRRLFDNSVVALDGVSIAWNREFSSILVPARAITLCG